MTAAMTSGLGDDVAMVSKKLVRAWEDAYRKYGAASETTVRSRTVDGATAWEMAHASWAVASAWRGIASNRGLVWWALAAVESAAEAFEDQARHWEERSHHNEDKGQGNGVQRDMVPGAGRGRGNADNEHAHRSGGARDIPGPGKPGDHGPRWPTDVAGVRAVPWPVRDGADELAEFFELRGRLAAERGGEI